MKNGDIICEEHGICLGDEDLIDAICHALDMSRAQFDALPEAEQHAWQLGWVAPMPYPAASVSAY